MKIFEIIGYIDNKKLVANNIYEHSVIQKPIQISKFKNIPENSKISFLGFNAPNKDITSKFLKSRSLKKASHVESDYCILDFNVINYLKNTKDSSKFKNVISLSEFNKKFKNIIPLENNDQNNEENYVYAGFLNNEYHNKKRGLDFNLIDISNLNIVEKKYKDLLDSLENKTVINSLDFYFNYWSFLEKPDPNLIETLRTSIKHIGKTDRTLILSAASYIDIRHDIFSYLKICKEFTLDQSLKSSDNWTIFNKILKAVSFINGNDNDLKIISIFDDLDFIDSDNAGIILEAKKKFLNFILKDHGVEIAVRYTEEKKRQIIKSNV